ncbi:MAG: protease inhibitor I42 family protein [Eubacteriales bacterium]|nr:protease inhibitor I42 family protein [Eubacteriales bacterium]
MRRLLSLTLTLLIVLTSCAVAYAEQEQTNTPWYELDENEEVLTVRLPANPSTGYTWKVTLSPRNTLKMKDHFVPGKPAEPGKGGTWVATFEGMWKAGDVLLTLNSTRNGTIPAETRKLHVFVSENNALFVREQKVRLSLKPSGRIDPMRPESTLTLKPTMQVLDHKLTVSATEKNNKKGDQTANFAIEVTDSGAFKLRRAPSGVLNPNYVYTARVTGTVNGKPMTARHTFKVKPGKVGVALTPKSVTLSADDPLSQGVFAIKLKDSDKLGAIDNVTTASKKFALKPLNDGNWAIGFKDGAVVTKGENVKLDIYLKGYDRPAATVKLMVRVK